MKMVMEPKTTRTILVILLALGYLSSALGQPSNAPLIISLPSSESRDSFKGPIVFIPDVNHDAISDLAVGVMEVDFTKAPQSRTVFIIDGSNGKLLTTIHALEGIDDGKYGNSVLGVEDKNGNGTGDLLLTATMHDDSWIGLYDGGTGELLNVYAPDNDIFHKFAGPLTILGDIDDDGGLEFSIIGREKNSTRPYVFGLGLGSSSPKYPTQSPAAREKHFGFSFVVPPTMPIPDMNGNGGRDYVVRAEDRPYYYDGKDGGVIDIDDTSRGPYLLEASYNHNGFNTICQQDVILISDLNGDGEDDIGIATNRCDTTVLPKGEFHIFSGRDGSVIAQHKCERELTDDTRLFNIADVTGDGHGDFLFYEEEDHKAYLTVYSGVSQEKIHEYEPIAVYKEKPRRQSIVRAVLPHKSDRESCRYLIQTGSDELKLFTLDFKKDERITIHDITQERWRYAGETLELFVAAGGALPRSYQWRKDGEQIQDDDRISGAAQSHLTITGARASDAGRYTCTVGNVHNSAISEVCVVKIVGTPAVRLSRRTSSVKIGDSILLSVSVEGKRPLSFRWEKNGQELPDTDSRYRGQHAPSLIISNASASDAGAYICHIENVDGLQLSEPIRVTVE